MKTTITLGIVSLMGLGSVSAGDVFQVLVKDTTVTWGSDTFGYMQLPVFTM